jgi:hypothetical protein
MGIRKQTARSHNGRDRAMTRGKEKNDSLAPADRFFTNQTESRLNTHQPLYRSSMQAVGVALANQAQSTSAVAESKETAKMFNSHFVQVFDFGIKRGKYVPAHRAHYQLPVNSDTLPRMVTENEILQVGDNIIAGDATRVTAGGAAMANPTAIEVDTAITDFRTLNNAQSNLKDAYDDAQETLDGMVPEADGVLKKVWDEVETRFNEEEPSSMRRKAREYGVVYVSDIDINFHFTLKNDADNSLLAGVHGELVETGNERDSDAAGRIDITSKITGQATFVFTHPDFVTQEITIEIPDDQTEFTQEVRLVHL